MTTREKFTASLESAYEDLFQRPDYAPAAKKHSPRSFAEKMTAGLLSGSANKDGEGIKRACKALGIPHTYKAIRAALTEVTP